VVFEDFEDFNWSRADRHRPLLRAVKQERGEEGQEEPRCGAGSRTQRRVCSGETLWLKMKKRPLTWREIEESSLLIWKCVTTSVTVILTVLIMQPKVVWVTDIWNTSPLLLWYVSV
jgi:hypothetical protein